MNRRIVAILVPIALLVACSTPGAGQSQGGTASTGPGASAGAGQSTGPGASEGAAASQGGGGGGSDACGLITTDEVASVLGVSGTNADPTPGTTNSYCHYTATDLSASVFTAMITADAGVAFGVYENEAGATKVSGIGDKAVYSPSTATLFILKGSHLAGITAGTGAMSEEERLALEKQLGTIAAGRL